MALLTLGVKCIFIIWYQGMSAKFRGRWEIILDNLKLLPCKKLNWQFLRSVVSWEVIYKIVTESAEKLGST